MHSNVNLQKVSAAPLISFLFGQTARVSHYCFDVHVEGILNAIFVAARHSKYSQELLNAEVLCTHRKDTVDSQSFLLLYVSFFTKHMTVQKSVIANHGSNKTIYAARLGQQHE